VTREVGRGGRDREGLVVLDSLVRVDGDLAQLCWRGGGYLGQVLTGSNVADRG
jgi:hypothetical protein